MLVMANKGKISAVYAWVDYAHQFAYYALKFYPLYASISSHSAHIMLEYPNRITGQIHYYFIYLTLIILQHQGQFNVVLYCKDQIY